MPTIAQRLTWNTRRPTTAVGTPDTTLDPPNGNSTALAVGGLWAAGFDPQASRFEKNGHGALDTLLTFQEPSGAFVYIRQPGQEEVRLMATLDVLAALASQLNGASVCRVIYLPLVLR